MTVTKLRDYIIRRKKKNVRKVVLFLGYSLFFFCPGFLDIIKMLSES